MGARKGGVFRNRVGRAYCVRNHKALVDCVSDEVHGRPEGGAAEEGAGGGGEGHVWGSKEG